MKTKVSIVIPNWNGRKLLQKNLPEVLKTLPPKGELIIVDDDSRDSSVSFIESLEPQARLIKNRQNRGFIYSCNLGVEKARGEFVVLLNSDVIPQKGFLEAALKHFVDPSVFAVSFNERQHGWAKVWWRGGFIHHGVGGRGRESHISAWASGGSAVYRKSMWEKLGGFDALYEPFYWEDFDLGFRAWKYGWKIIWEPKAVVDHKHESTISKIDQDYVDLIRERNQLLFIWKNISHPWWRFSNILGMILRIFLGPNYLKVIFAARKQYRHFGKPRHGGGKLTDKQVVFLFK